jgi:hypothetical protein
MKKIQILKGLLFTVLATIFFSCSSNNSSESPTTTGSISASISGVAWSGVSTANLQSTTYMGTTKSNLQIMGLNIADYSNITIQIPVTSLNVGTFSSTATNSVGMMTYSTNANTPTPTVYTSTASGSSFSITITAINATSGLLSGTFTGTLKTQAGATKTITNGVLDSVSIVSTEYFPGGTMSLSKNGGNSFSMGEPGNPNFVMITQASVGNTVVVSGTNTSVTNNFGIYSINFPKTVTLGTYNLMTSPGFGASIGKASGQPDYNLTSGSMTIQSHNGTNVIGTFNYTVSNGTDTVTITNGSFNVTHH